MTILWLDTESFSTVDIKAAGPYRYAEDPSTELLMCAYAIDDEPVRIAVGALEMYEQMEPFFDQPDGMTYAAMNATFDRVMIGKHMGMPTGKFLDPARWLDPSVLASCAGYPASLDKLTKALGVTQKDSAGTLLINLFSKPNRKGGRNGPETHPEKWELFKEYCVNDVVAMRDAARLLPQQLPWEREIWIADQRINDRGVRLDLPMAKAAVDAVASNRIAARREVIELTGVNNPGSVPQMLDWFDGQGIPLDNLRKDTVSAVLADPSTASTPRRVLELRQELALASAPAKFKAALVMSNSDGRLRGAFRYHGAHTGRWTGRGIQLHNLPRKSLKGWEALAIAELKAGFGASPEDLKALVRPLVLGPLTILDYSQIEARVIAWLAGEQWVLDAFAGGRDIYIETAKRMKMPDPENEGRQAGKSAVLGFGFGGGIMAARNVGAKGSDEELGELVKLYRSANPKIRQFWYDLWEVFVRGGELGKITVERSNGIRKLTLPSGRSITYRGVVAKRVEKETESGRKYMAYDVIYRQPVGKIAKLWHGLIAENVVQATARDLMAGCLPVLDRLGAPVVAHVHDEIIIEGDWLALAEKIMLDKPKWADGLPVDAEGKIVNRYTKG